MASGDPIKIQVSLDESEVKTGADRIKDSLLRIVGASGEAGKQAGTAFGKNFTDGSSSAMGAGLDGARKKAKDLGNDLQAEAGDAGKRFGSSLGGAVRAAFEGNISEALKKLGEMKEAAGEIGKALSGGGEAIKATTTAIEGAGAAAEGATVGFEALAVGIGVVIGAIAVAGAAFLGLGHIFAEHIIELDRMSRATDVSINDLAVLHAAFEEAGGSANNMASAIQHLQNFTEAARAGNQKNIDLLLKYGITSKDTTEQINEGLIAIGKLTDQTEKARLATKLFGAENAQLILSFKGMDKGMEGVNEEFGSYARNITPEAIEQTKHLEASQQELNKQWDLFKTNIGKGAVPALDWLITKLNDAANAYDKFSDKLEAAGKRHPDESLLGLILRGRLSEPIPTPESQPPTILEPGVGPLGPESSPETKERLKREQEARDRQELEDARKTKADREESAKAIRAAQRTADQATRDQAEAAAADLAKLQKDANDRQLADLEASFKLGLKDYHDYYDDRLTLTRSSIQAEIDLIFKRMDLRREELADIQKQKAELAGVPKSEAEVIRLTAEETRVKTQLSQLQNELTIKVRDYKQAETEAAQAAGHTNVGLGEQVQLLHNYKDASDQIKESIKERAAVVRADPLFQESERVKRSIEDLQKILAAPEANFIEQQKEAYLAALVEIVNADKAATLSIIRDRVIMADATIYHSTRSTAIFLDHLAQQKSATQIMGDAMVAVYEGVAGAIDKGISKLTAKLGLFGDAVKEVLSGITRQILNVFLVGQGKQAGSGGLLGGLGLLGGGGGTTGGGGGLGGILGALFQGGGGGTQFAAPAFASQATGAAAILGGGAINQQGLAALFGGSVAVPASLTGTQASSNAITRALGVLFGSAGPSTGTAVGGTGLAGFSGSIGGFGPALLGAVAGTTLGGSSGFGKVLGGIGGGILGVGLGIAGTAIGLGAGIAVALAPLLGAGLLAAPFIIGALLLSKAAQRKKDEALADSYWKSAADQIVELTREVNSDKIDGQDAFAQALALRAQAISQIQTIKTASVRESRLAHQIPDLDRVYIEPLKRAVEAQARRVATGQKLVPEFAGGGIVGGLDRGYDSVLARVRPGEVVLTREQQMRIGGADALRFAGVPGFADGGVVPSVGSSGPISINLDLWVGVSEKDAGELVVTGVNTPQGQKVVVTAVKRGQKNREL